MSEISWGIVPVLHSQPQIIILLHSCHNVIMLSHSALCQSLVLRLYLIGFRNYISKFFNIIRQILGLEVSCMLFSLTNNGCLLAECAKVSSNGINPNDSSLTSGATNTKMVSSRPSISADLCSKFSSSFSVWNEISQVP